LKLDIEEAVTAYSAAYDAALKANSAETRQETLKDF
jgi:hypothetical protein